MKQSTLDSFLNLKRGRDIESKKVHSEKEAKKKDEKKKLRKRRKEEQRSEKAVKKKKKRESSLKKLAPETKTSNSTIPQPKPFWNSLTAKISNSCVLLTNINVLPAEPILNLQQLGEHWFSTKAQKVATAFSTFDLWSRNLWNSIPATKLSEEENSAERTEKKSHRISKDKPPAGRTKKIKLYPTETQRKTLNRWFGTARWTYNRCLDAVKNGCPRNKKSLRARCVNNDLWTGELAWLGFEHSL